MDPNEEFSKPGLRRAFAGRASPEEFLDTLRLARLVGRCTSDNAPTYGQAWFGLDCNAFVGNYQGISPSSSIASYVSGYGTKAEIKGATDDVYITRNLLPLPPIEKVEDIKKGTVIVTYRPGSTTSHGDHWGHIGLVQSFGPDPAPNKMSLHVIEWGKKGGIASHTDGPPVNHLAPRRPRQDHQGPQGQEAVRLLGTPTGKTCGFSSTRRPGTASRPEATTSGAATRPDRPRRPRRSAAAASRGEGLRDPRRTGRSAGAA